MAKREKVINLVKFGGEIIGSCGAQALACGLVRLVLPPGLNVVIEGGMLVGGLLLGGFVGDKLNDYTAQKIDETVKEFDEMTERIKRDLDTLKDKETEEKPE